ncbi:MAG: SGNH/GDSL hydrolase family protein [Casimicrobiaceae bacterium]
MQFARSKLPPVLLVLLASSCGGGSDSSTDAGAQAPLSVVVIGDSIAAGEGINYGYVYSTGFPNKWTGGSDNPVWQGNYQLCHDSVFAYGDVLAPMLSATLTKFACTGSTYDNGIAFDRRADALFYRPAQFGNWLGMTNLNAQYDLAKPDVVIVTFGADDVSFADIVTFCATGYTDANEVAALGQLANPSQQLRRNFARKFPTADAWQHRPPRALESSYCTAANPGAPINSLFWDPINSGQITGHYKDIVAAIQQRGTQAGKVPKIIFTTYHQPMPSPGQSDECLDLGDLERGEINYLISLENTLKSTLIAAVSGLNGVTIADMSNVVQGHEYCTGDPWAYGLSVLLLNDDSLAPFHPTPAGQAAYAAVLKQSFASR